MSDEGGVVGNLISVDELLTPQFLYPVCGVIICAVAVFLVGVGFKSSSEPKFEISGEGDGVPFLKKKKKQKVTTAPSQTSKKAQIHTSTQLKPVKGRRSEEYLHREPAISTKPADVDRDVNESTIVVTDEWITPVSRKEKKARRRETGVKSGKENEEFPDSDIQPEISAVVHEEPAAVAPPTPQRRPVDKKQRTSRTDESKKDSVTVETTTTQEKSGKVAEEAKTKKAPKQKQKQQEAVEPVTSSDHHPRAAETAPKTVPATTPAEPKTAPTSSPKAAAASTKKKKKGVAVESGPAPGAFQLAEFELPTTAAPAQRPSPSPPSTDSSFELVDADAVREAIEEAEEEKAQPVSKTSGASKKKNKKGPTVQKAPSNFEKITEEPAKASSQKPATSQQEPSAPTPSPTSDEPPAESDDWQDAKSSRKRRRARRDD